MLSFSLPNVRGVKKKHCYRSVFSSFLII